MRLSEKGRQELEVIVKKGKGGAHKIRNAQILLPTLSPKILAGFVLLICEARRVLVGAMRFCERAKNFGGDGH